MDSKRPFGGRAYYEQVEAYSLDRMIEEARTGLRGLERSTRRARLGYVRSFAGEIRTVFLAIDRGLRDGEGTKPFTLLLCESLDRFQDIVRSYSRARGPTRVAIEKVWILLNVIQIELLRRVPGSNQEGLDRLRGEVLAGLWSQPAVGPKTRGPELDWRHLAIDLQNIWLRRLSGLWCRFNEEYLKGRLVAPIFQLSDSRTTCGQWQASTRTIAVSGWHLTTHSWEDVVDTLRHEMAHQYVDEVLRPIGERPHGEAFRQACHLLRCNASRSAAADQLVRLDASSDPQDRMLVRVQKLLALGQSSNRHEAEVAMRKASELLLKYNLELSALEAARSYTSRCIGAPVGRCEEYHKLVSTILADHFFVRVIWLHSYIARTNSRASRLQIIGTPENIEIAEYVHDFLHATLVRLWEAHRASDRFRGGRKQQFMAGLAGGFLQKLQEQRHHLQVERALVWKGDGNLDGHFRYLHPRIVTMRSAGVVRGEDYWTGIEQGRRIQLHRGVHERSADTGGLLPAASGPDRD